MPTSMGSFDIIGPIMVGPSSSHTAGAVRLGKIARLLLGEQPRHVRILLHGSFRETYRGHGTDLALLAGLLGLNTDDIRIRKADQLAQDQGLEYIIEPVVLGAVHPNTVKLILSGQDGYHLEMVGSSLGGGNIVVTEINGFAVEIYGKYDTLVIVHQDQPGVIAQVTNVLAQYGINVANMRVARKNKGKQASMMIEIDQHVQAKVIKEIEELSTINSVRFVGKV